MVTDTIIDTVKVIEDFYTRKYYTEEFKDSTYTATLSFETYKGNVENMLYTHQLTSAGTVINNFVEVPLRNRIFIGGFASAEDGAEFDIGPSLMFLHRSDTWALTGSYGVAQKNISVGLYYKISLRKRL